MIKKKLEEETKMPMKLNVNYGRNDGELSENEQEYIGTSKIFCKSDTTSSINTNSSLEDEESGKEHIRALPIKTNLTNYNEFSTEE
jgi:hypothetical protein